MDNSFRIEKVGDLNPELVEWNNNMYQRHPTPYRGIAGIIEWARIRTVFQMARIGLDDNVLEIGCEAGNLLFQCPDAQRIVGVDISSRALQDAYHLFEKNKRSVEFYQLDAQVSLPFSEGEFSVIICSEVLEHVKSPRDVLRNIHRISNAGTRIIISIPTEATKILIKRVLLRLKLFHLLFPGIEEMKSEWHLHTFSKHKLVSLNGDLFKIRRSSVVWFNHYVALMSVNNK